MIIDVIINYDATILRTRKRKVENISVFETIPVEIPDMELHGDNVIQHMLSYYFVQYFEHTGIIMGTQNTLMKNISISKDETINLSGNGELLHNRYEILSKYRFLEPNKYINENTYDGMPYDTKKVISDNRDGAIKKVLEQLKSCQVLDNGDNLDIYYPTKNKPFICVNGLTKSMGTNTYNLDIHFVKEESVHVENYLLIPIHLYDPNMMIGHNNIHIEITKNYNPNSTSEKDLHDILYSYQHILHNILQHCVFSNNSRGEDLKKQYHHRVMAILNKHIHRQSTHVTFDDVRELTRLTQEIKEQLHGKTKTLIDERIKTRNDDLKFVWFMTEQDLEEKFIPTIQSIVNNYYNKIDMKPKI